MNKIIKALEILRLEQTVMEKDKQLQALHDICQSEMKSVYNAAAEQIATLKQQQEESIAEIDTREELAVEEIATLQAELAASELRQKILSDKWTRENLELSAELDAWKSVFGTTQLSHAQARLEQAEKTSAKQAGEIADLTKMLLAGEPPYYTKWKEQVEEITALTAALKVSKALEAKFFPQESAYDVVKKLTEAGFGKPEFKYGNTLLGMAENCLEHSAKQAGEIGRLREFWDQSSIHERRDFEIAQAALKGGKGRHPHRGHPPRSHGAGRD